MIAGRINRRRIIIPLLILAVAAALAVWGSQQSQRTTEQVRRMVQQVCYEMAHDGDHVHILGWLRMWSCPELFNED